MPEHFGQSKETPYGSDVSEQQNPPESERNEQIRRFTIEIKGQKFDFLELQSAEPSDTLLLHFPGFGEDSEQYTPAMHACMGKGYCTVALRNYSEVYSRESLIQAFEQVIAQSGKQHVVLHGDSFGAGVVYDLISDQAEHELIKRNHVLGAILEAPFLDKQHLLSRIRLAPDAALLRGGILYDKIRNLKSLSPTRGLIELSQNQKQSMMTEALREKTVERKIDIPIFVVLVQNESLSNNEKVIETLQSQAANINFSTVNSADDNGHHVADDQYDNMWAKEKEVVDGFISSNLTEPNASKS